VTFIDVVIWSCIAASVVVAMNGLARWRSGGEWDVLLAAFVALGPSSRLIGEVSEPLAQGFFVAGAACILVWWINLRKRNGMTSNALNGSEIHQRGK
jgi:hypothetical protein